ncbi:5-formyltetrahydrofolate cyclo-ligase [Streptomyces cheonanensis]|uniref:5-formyltetrahydrofolate cyclo-ligase n=1 Tax=Streptomyces cheonanensis TaxID=312720 RepID=A0ABN2VA49_9ACTN|nr:MULTISPECIES: 5-formyltetrahydrofolate cyclo-ligase [Streptomyces]
MDHVAGTAHDGKRAVRRDLLAVRAALSDDEVLDAAAALAAQAMGLPELAAARTVAAYVSVGHEPGTLALLDALRERGVRVLLPVLREDDDLDWGTYEGPGALVETERAGRMRLREPAGERLGREAVLAADVVLLPGLAVDARGVRMGRGGGSYDRVLARLAAAGADPVPVVLLYGHEVVGELPVEPHDRPVRVAVTPEGVHRFPG